MTGMVRAMAGMGAVIHPGHFCICRCARHGMALVRVVCGVIFHVMHGMIHLFMLRMVFPLLLHMFGMIVNIVLFVVFHRYL